MILVLLGSPNTDGNTNSVVKKILEDSQEEVVYIDTANNKISGCTDCKFCSYKSGCSIKDEMKSIYDYILKADTLVIASPLYFATFPGDLINYLSRFQTYYAAKYERKEMNPHIKKAVLVVTAGGYWESMFCGVKETFNIMKLLFNIKETKELLIPRCDKVIPLELDEVKEHINAIQEFIKNS